MALCMFKAQEQFKPRKLCHLDIQAGPVYSI